VNETTPALFERFPTPESLVGVEFDEVFAYIKGISYPANKSRHLLQTAEILVREHGGQVPNDYNALLALPGVGRKTYIVLSKAFGKHVGLAVDTHVFRVAPRLGLSDAKTAEKMSQELGVIFMPRDYLSVNELFITHGRAVCIPRKPRCGECVLAEICPSAKAFLG